MDKNLIECATCGYPLTKDERTGLTEINGKMYRPWVGLTESEIVYEWELWKASIPRYFGFAKGIEAKLKEKNHATRQYQDLCDND